jgi:hypothetical protein
LVVRGERTRNRDIKGSRDQVEESRRSEKLEAGSESAGQRQKAGAKGQNAKPSGDQGIEPECGGVQVISARYEMRSEEVQCERTV